MILSKTKFLLHEYPLKIFMLYLVMVSGGVIQYLGIFQKEMGVLATFVIGAISIFIYLEYYWYAGSLGLTRSKKRNQIKRFSIWLGLVFVISVVVENIGVLTGNIFGQYTYGPVLNPFIGHVPLAIGFAWINTLAPSMMISKFFIKRSDKLFDWLSAVLVGILMVIFDIVLENAAIELTYWHWQNKSIPLQNYIAWFILGFVFARIGFYLKIHRFNFPEIYQHIYLAQLGYFLLVIIR